MSEEAQKIKSIKAEKEYEQAVYEFYKRYRAVAFEALQHLADLSSHPDAKNLIEKALLESEFNIPKEPPESIALIYQGVFNLSGFAATILRPACNKPLIQLGCILALLVNKECHYYFSQRDDFYLRPTLDYTRRDTLYTPAYFSHSAGFS